MSIWYDGTNLNMYRGDSGTLIFTGLPLCPGYRCYFSVKSIKSGEIIFEEAGDPEFYYIDNEGEIIEKLETETMDEYIHRCEEMVETGDAIKKCKCKIFISADKTERLFVLKSETNNEYYYGFKICFSATGIENTLIPTTKFDEETGQIIFKDPPKLIVRPKFAEGIMGCECFDELEIAAQNPKDYGLQPLLTPTENILIDKENRIDIGKELVDRINHIDALQEQVDTLSDIVDETVESIEDLENITDEHTSDISSINETLTAHQSELNSHSTKIASLEQTVGNYRSGLVKSVNDINDKIAHYGDIVTHNTNEFQATLTEGMGIKITNNEVSVNLGIEQLNNVLIEDLQDGDILMYSAGLGKWINRQLP